MFGESVLICSSDKGTYCLNDICMLCVFKYSMWSIMQRKNDKWSTYIFEFRRCAEPESAVPFAGRDELPLSGEYYGQVAVRGTCII